MNLAFANGGVCREVNSLAGLLVVVKSAAQEVGSSAVAPLCSSPGDLREPVVQDQVTGCYSALGLSA